MNDNNNNMTGGKPTAAAAAKNKSLRLGGYSAAVTLAVVAIAVVINLIVLRLPSRYTKLDVSSVGMFTLSEQTTDIVRAIGDDITIYFIAKTGAEDSNVLELLSRYSSLNSRISVQKVDPDIYPNFVGQYTSESLSENSLIVEGEKRSRVVDYNEIFVVEYSFDANYNMQTSTSFAGEASVTSALDYVTSDALPKVYMLDGHGEAALSAVVFDYIKKDNIETQQLSLLPLDKVPADADCVLINMPASDITEDEAGKLISYIDGGGAVLIISGYDPSSFAAAPNLYSVGAHMGITGEYGLVVEGSANNYYQIPYYLLPKLGTHEIITTLPNENIYVFTPFAMGLKILDTMPRPTTKAYPLLYTTASAYLKTGEFETFEKAEGDESAAYAIAAAATDGTSKLVWFASPFIVDENFDLGGGNTSLFLSSLKWITGKTTSVSIASKLLKVAGLMFTETEANVWGAVISAVIPLAFVGIGLSVWVKRRRR